MKLIFSPWRKEFESFLAHAKHNLRVIAPYYGIDTIQKLLRGTKKGVEKSFIFALSDRGVDSGSQSIAAINHIRADPFAKLRLIRNLHAKVLIADGKHAIITSANMTGAALDNNVEVGIYLNEPLHVLRLLRHFDDLWIRAASINTDDLKRLEQLEHAAKSRRRGNSYGSQITFLGRSKRISIKNKTAIGWVLIHSKKRYESPQQFDNPIEELRRNHKPRRLWHWNRSKPLKEGGPYRLLFAWDGNIFGECYATVTHAIKNEGDFNFAFILQDYKETKSVALSKLPLPHRHRDMLRLTEPALRKYEALLRS